MIDLYILSLGILFFCAVMDLIVGVSNDAVNFLNSSIGSRAAPRRVIMIIASMGILAGVLFSSGMMEVARKGIFHPRFFTMPELMTIFTAVMLTDILLLDLFNTYGLPTSTTVSIVFDLLGAAVAISMIKVMQAGLGPSEIGTHINTSKAMFIIMGILLSVVIAFLAGAISQFVTRLIFSFDYMGRIRKLGALWGGMAMATIVLFILVQDVGGIPFISDAVAMWIKSHTMAIFIIIFLLSALVLQILIMIWRINIFKPIVLVGTFALAMSFAANDLVNFIGVPLAGLHAYRIASNAANPLQVDMSAMAGKVHSDTFLLLASGIIMVMALWMSRKAKTVTETEVSLGKQGEGIERFESIFLSRIIVRMTISMFDIFRAFIPESFRRFVAARIDPERANLNESHLSKTDHEAAPAFDLVRAAVNLVVASAVISSGTAMKLPLSTTYVTFMVAMGSSFSDKAWGRESAVYRVTGVLTVIGGWFMTALIAFTAAFLFAGVIHYLSGFGILGLILLTVFIMRKANVEHIHRTEQEKETQIFKLGNIVEPQQAMCLTFEQMGRLLHEIRQSLDQTFLALFSRDIAHLRQQKNKVKRVQVWINSVIANIFDTLRIMPDAPKGKSFTYAQTIRRLQKLSDAYRDIVLRSYIHINNNHAGFPSQQAEELNSIKDCLLSTVEEMEGLFLDQNEPDILTIPDKEIQLNEIARRLDEIQIDRIQKGDSKTRLSILYYAIIGDCKVIARQIIRLLSICTNHFQLGSLSCPIAQPGGRESDMQGGEAESGKIAANPDPNHPDSFIDSQ